MDISDKVKYLKQYGECWHDQLSEIFTVYDVQLKCFFLGQYM